MQRIFTYRLHRKIVGFVTKDDNGVYYAYYGKNTDNLVHSGGLEETTDKLDEYFVWKLGLFEAVNITIS